MFGQSDAYPQSRQVHGAWRIDCLGSRHCSPTSWRPALARGRGRELDLLIGTNADEWYMYIDPAIGPGGVNDWIADTAPEYAGSLLTEVAAETVPRKATDRLRTARDTLCPARHLAAVVSAQGGQGFVYYFTRNRPEASGDELGVYHGAELPYVFAQHGDWLPADDADDVLCRYPGPREK